MKVILINPKTLFPGKMLSVPLALLQIGSLPYKEGHEVEILDCNLIPISKIEKNIKDEDPDVIGFTTLTGKSLHSCIRLSKFAKQNSNAVVVWGGIHTSLLPFQVINEDYVDVACVGEGDFTFNDLINNLRCLEKVKGILHKENGKTKSNLPNKQIEDLDKIPDICWDLIPVKKYVYPWIEGVKTIGMQTSRGCPFGCTFCYNTIFNKGRWRPNSVKRVKDNLDNLISQYPIEAVRVDYDDNFIGIDRRRALQISYEFKKHDLKWGCAIRVDQVNRKILQTFKDNGNIYIGFGVESGSPRILKLLNKGISVSDVVKTFDIVNEIGARGVAFFMLDLPTETSKDLNQTYKLSKRIDAIVSASSYQPYPGTKLFDYVTQNNMYKAPTSTDEWAASDFSGLHCLSKIPKWKLKEVYYRMNYYHNIIITLKKDFGMFRLLSKSSIRALYGGFHR